MPSPAVERRYIGLSRRRSEDHRLLTGRGEFVGDLLSSEPQALHAAFVRSPYAHARIVSMDVEAVRSAAGVVAVVTPVDVAELEPMLLGSAQLPGAGPRKVLPPTETVFVGEPVVAVLAGTAAEAADALDLVVVEYEPLPPVSSLSEAVARDAVRANLGQLSPNNVVGRLRQSAGDVESAFQQAPRRLTLTLTHGRVAGVPIEPRGILAQTELETGRLVVHLSTQAPFRAQTELARILRLNTDQVRVVAPDVGGGFGVKGALQPEELIVAYAAQTLGRAVCWQSTRTEDFLTTTQARDSQTVVEVALSNDGTVLALRLRTLANLGAYPASPGPPTRLLHYATGCYRIEHLDSEVQFVLTNTPPTGAYRGAGRPEAAFVAERVMDEVAALLGLDPVEVRRRNFIPPQDFPYRNAGGVVYDSGNYAASLDSALALADYEQLRLDQQARRARGELVGIGVATYTEVAGSGWEEGQVEIANNGRVVAHTGSSAHGQGHATTFAQIVGDALGVAPEAVDVIASDTDSPIRGMGTFGSRSTVLGGNALFIAATTVRNRLLDLAASLLEVAPEDLHIRDGRVHVRGAEQRFLDFASLAAAAAERREVTEYSLREAVHFSASDGDTFPFGACVAIVSIGSATGKITLERLVLVDDCGRVINPVLVEGQLAGGMVQGIGEALREQVVFGTDAQLLSGSLLDYAVPRARDVPTLEMERTETPSPLNPLGVKGVGEAGTVGTPAVIANAVLDALRPRGISEVRLPITAEQVYRLLCASATADESV
jgi:aerobic carbon-monoxide dehydrogenase large subunit